MTPFEAAGFKTDDVFTLNEDYKGLPRGTELRLKCDDGDSDPSFKTVHGEYFNDGTDWWYIELSLVRRVGTPAERPEPETGTHAERAGLKVGNIVTLSEDHQGQRAGSKLRFTRDDGSDRPRFDTVDGSLFEDGDNWHYVKLRNVRKVEQTPFEAAGYAADDILELTIEECGLPVGTKLRLVQDDNSTRPLFVTVGGERFASGNKDRWIWLSQVRKFRAQTPFEAAGFSADDVLVVMEHHCEFAKGTRVVLAEDDNTDCPWFSGVAASPGAPWAVMLSKLQREEVAAGASATETPDASAPLPAWAARRSLTGDHMEIGAQLSTRDGRRMGNAVVMNVRQGDDGPLASVITDIGNDLEMSEAELKEAFYAPTLIMELSAAAERCVEFRALNA